MCQFKQEIAKQYGPLQVKLHHFQFLFVAIATTILKAETKWNDVHNLPIAIYPCFKFHEKIYKTFKVIAWSRKVWRTDRLTDGQSANQKSPPVSLVGDKSSHAALFY